MRKDRHMSSHATIELQAPGVSVRIEPQYGGRFSSWRVGETELLWQPDGEMPGASHPFGWGSFVMAPYAGRIRRGRFEFDSRAYELPIAMAPHAIHGTVYDCVWAVESVVQGEEESACELSVRLSDPWPFAGEVKHRISLRAGGDGRTGSVTQQLVLTAEESMPVTMGWHPWFPRELPGATGPIEWSFDRRNVSMFQRDGDGISSAELSPIPDGRWDDCFLGVGEVTVRWPGLIDLSMVHDCPVVVLFDGLDHAVCVEPQTGPPNATELWPAECRVEAGEARRASTTWSWEIQR
jgi:aldose 1-epimerase